MATVHDNQSTAPGSGGEQQQAAAGPAAAQSTAPGSGGEQGDYSFLLVSLVGDPRGRVRVNGWRAVHGIL